MLNDEVRDEMDAYGGHLQVVIEDANMQLWDVSEVTSYSRSGGVLVVLTVGGKADA